jgi:hypothetical protein
MASTSPNLSLRDRTADSVTQFQIFGATGVYSSFINGLYQSTLQQCGGKPVYHNCDNSDIWLEYDGKGCEWNVLNTAHRGMSWGYASLKSLHDVNSCEGDTGWKVFDGRMWTDQPSVRLKIVSTITAPELPKQPPPPPPVSSAAAATSVSPRNHNVMTPGNALGAGNHAAAAKDARLASLRTNSQVSEQPVVRHIDFDDRTLSRNHPLPPAAVHREQKAPPTATKHHFSGVGMPAQSNSSSFVGGRNAAPATPSGVVKEDGDIAGHDVASDGNMSYSQIVKNRRLHIDALEPGHPKVIVRLLNQQLLPVQALKDRLAELKLRAIETTAAIIDGISVERARAKTCLWSTTRFSQGSESFMDALVATGQRMEAEQDVYGTRVPPRTFCNIWSSYLVREGDDTSSVIFYLASGQIKFCR